MGRLRRQCQISVSSQKINMAGLKSQPPYYERRNEYFLRSFHKQALHQSDIDAMWTEFGNKCAELMTEHIPSKFSLTPYSQPWTNRNLKRLSRKKKRAYKKANISGKDSDCANYKLLKKECTMEYRTVYSTRAKGLISKGQTGNPKKLYSFIKSKKSDASWVFRLQQNVINHSDNEKKSIILNDQFASVFPVENTTTLTKLKSTDHPI